MSLLLRTLLLLLLALSISWHPARQEIDAPPGCRAPFAATSRGGGSFDPPGGGGCNISGGKKTGEVEVVRIIDGDTIEIKGGDRVRYIGIDTPEEGPVPEPFAGEATRFNAQLVEGKRIILEMDVSNRDRFGRLLRFVYADGILVNAELIREGYAVAKVFPPDTRYGACFAALEEEAREGGRGMWSTWDGGT